MHKVESVSPQVFCQAIEEYVGFFRAFGDEGSFIPRLQDFSRRFQQERITKKLIKEFNAFNDGAVDPQVAAKVRAGNYLPGKDSTETVKEYCRVRSMITDALYPQKPLPPEIDISAFTGAEKITTKTTQYAGDPQAVGPIVERSLA